MSHVSVKFSAAAGLLLAGAVVLPARAGVPPAGDPPAATTGVAAPAADAEAPGPAAAAEATDPAAEATRTVVSDWVRRGNEARQAGRLKEAIEAYRAAAGLDPRRYEIRILLADTLRRMGKVDDAKAAYVEAVRLDPSRSQGYTGQALMLRGAYRFDEAAALIDKAMARVREGDRGDLLVSLGETRRRAGRGAEAAALFNRALEVDPAAVGARAGLAFLSEDSGALDEAIHQWGRYLEARPADGAAELRRQELREVRAAIAALRQTSAEAEGRARAALTAEMARLLGLSGDQGAAAAAWRDAVRLDGGNVPARRNLALALVRLGDDRGAAAEFRRVLKAVPDDGVSLYHLAAIARRASDSRAEETAWTELVTRRPGDLYAARAWAQFVTSAGEGTRQRALAASAAGADLPARRRRVLLLAGAGMWEQVGQALAAALAVDPTDPWTLDVAQDVMARRPALLAQVAERARATAVANPEDPMALLLVARCAALGGRGDRASAAVRRAAEIAPESSVVQSALAEILQGAGPDPGPALRALRRACDLDPARVAAHVDLALAQLRAGHATEALEAARRGLARHPASPELLSLAGATLAETGALEEAARSYAAALVADPADNFHLARGQYPLVLAALERGVEARRALAGDLPEFPDLAYLEAWMFARDSSRDRGFHGQDWEAWRGRSAGPGAGPAEAHRAIAEMLDSLGDPYTRLRDPEETAAVYLTRHDGAAGTDLLGRQRPHGRTVTAGDLPGNMGYIQIANLTDPNVVAEVRRALVAMREKEGIVLDLRGNPGGLARSADAVADMLIGPGQETGVDVTPDGARQRISGGDGAIASRPVTVMVDGQTGSAAERLAASLDVAGRAEIVGDTTFGKGLFQSTRVLPGGHTVLVSAGERLGPDGQPIQGRGLRPRGQGARPVPIEEPPPSPPPSAAPSPTPSPEQPSKPPPR